MNIKLKAGLTVMGFFSAMIGVMVGIISIPDMWIKRYGLLIIETVAIIGSLVFAYFMALDYYKADEELKQMEKEREESNKKLDEMLKDMEKDRVF